MRPKRLSEKDLARAQHPQSWGQDGGKGLRAYRRLARNPRAAVSRSRGGKMLEHLVFVDRGENRGCRAEAIA